ncbi:protein MIZU-KUSSEI 1 [Silene latifolia]|uniref:protein MIZU-KUSSEI 1 n=1 Tax=Silene latifolia TaxID=37657 RepID=UPI003D784DF2
MPPPQNSTPFKHLKNPSTLLSLLRHSNPNDTTNKRTKHPSKTSSSGGLLKMFKLFPLLTSGCKMVALLAGSKSHRRAMIADHATIGTLFGSRRGRITLAIQEDPHSLPFFVIELPILSSSFHKEMACDILRVALESETKTHKKKLMEEFVWAVYCNGKKVGYGIRRKQLSEDDVHVMKMLRGVSMGAGVLPSSHNNNNKSNKNNHNYDRNRNYEHDFEVNYEEGDLVEEKSNDNGDQLTYLRARFQRVVGSKDSEAFYMINPDHSDGPELSVFFVRGSFN